MRIRGAPSRPLLLLALGVVACSTADSHVGCSPTLTCSLRESRFKPTPQPDAGPLLCGVQRYRCKMVKIAAGGAHSCAIAEAGELFCWGSDDQGQRGDEVAAIATSASAATGGGRDAGPRFVRVFSEARQVATGLAHTCVLTTDGAVLCWGRDAEGQVDGVERPEPIADGAQVVIPAASAVAAGAAHTCALASDGVECWGSARYGQVGREVTDGALGPALVPGTEGALQVAAGVRHSCALLGDGTVVCWGELIDEASGQPTSVPDATKVNGLDHALEIAVGAGQSCARRVSGEVVCWGANDDGQLGDGSRTSSATPVAVVGLTHALHVSAGGGELNGQLVGHSCAVDTDFHVQCWGSNATGELGTGEGADRSKAAVVLGFADEADQPYVDNTVALSAGAFHTCSLDHDGPVVCWGDDAAGQLGVTKERAPPFGRATTVERFAQ